MPREAHPEDGSQPDLNTKAPNVPFRVNEITFSDGSRVDTSDVDIVVLVGPNNVGKSRTLQEIEWFFTQSMVDPRSLYALRNIGMSRLMGDYQVERWLETHRMAWPDPAHPGRKVIYTYNANPGAHNNNGQLQLASIIGNWHQGSSSPFLGHLAAHLMQSLSLNQRLQGISGAPRPEVGTYPSHPFHALVADKSLLNSFKESFTQAFGMNVIMDGWGNGLRMRVSSDKTQEDFRPTTTIGLADPELSERISRELILETQSDGVRSFTGILLTLMSGKFPLVIIDEPEAFLHPPQARLLGRQLAEWHGDGQTFVATHSLDVLLGLVEKNPGRVLIIRLTRNSDGVIPHVLPPDKLVQISKDPLLRFSRTLDGLFHQGVIICEGDTDSQFYSLIASRARIGLWPMATDVMFTPGGGKQRIPAIASSLRALGVPVRIIVDFDAMNDSGILQSLVESVGASYLPAWEQDRRVLDAHIRGSESPLKAGALLKAVETIVGNNQDKLLSRHDVSKIREALQPSTGWRAAKQHGMGVVPSGDASIAADTLLANLRKIGIYVVYSGAVESFVRTVGGKSGAWIADVVERDFISTASEAHRFVDSILESIIGG